MPMTSGLWFHSSDPCLATDCKYANKFHFHCLFGNCKYVCKTSGKAESHCLDHINPNNNLVNVRDQFAYYSLQCLCPNQVSVGGRRGRGRAVQGAGRRRPQDQLLLAETLSHALFELASSRLWEGCCLPLGPGGLGQGFRLVLSW